ncbi:MAG TPA: hypothetical protein VFY40_06475 [Blastocatellia bacterium]|nr:hypothetical protein [Blastocatellia bacterium]
MEEREWLHEVVDGKYHKTSDIKENNWVWSPQGVVNMHAPEKWGHVRFITAPTGIERNK